MNAGLSAIKMGLRLWAKHLGRWAKLAGYVAGGVLVAAWLLFSAFVEALVLALAVGVVVLALTGFRCPPDARRWLQGGMGERRTARALAVAKRTGRLVGWWFAHDLKIPKSRANLDHVAVHPSGRLAVYLDTKAWHAKNAVVRVDGGKLKYGPWDQTKALDTIAWEASKLRDGLRGAVQVVPILVCDKTKVDGGVIDLNGVYVVASTELPRVLRSLASNPRDKRQARDVRRLVQANFPIK